MKGTKKWSAFALIAGIAMLFCSCAVHRHSRHHHRVLIVAKQTTNTGQSKDCITFEECLAMTEPDSYGNIE